MRKAVLIVLSVLAAAVSCSKNNTSGELPDWQQYVKQDTTTTSASLDTNLILYPERTKLVSGSDMVLLYGGSFHRTPSYWNESYLRDYVMYTDKAGNKHWFFDSFLCLEFMMTQYDVTLITGYSYGGKYLESATKEHWTSLADYYFLNGYNLDELESAVKASAKYLGDPPSKRKVFIGVPEAIKYKDSHNTRGGTTYWGELDGVQMDFSIQSHRVKALKWYINRVISNFGKKNYKYIELAGFYWVPEKATNTRDMINDISEYLHELNFALSWIPYYTADGYNRWASFGFDFAYYQPNYFFNEMDCSRLNTACEQAQTAKMGVEVEFDGNAMAGSEKKWGYKLREYLDIFKQYGFWDSSIIAYYQGSWAVKWLKDSSNSEDKDLFYYFGDWVVSRPCRESN